MNNFHNKTKIKTISSRKITLLTIVFYYRPLWIDGIS